MCIRDSDDTAHGGEAKDADQERANQATDAVDRKSVEGVVDADFVLEQHGAVAGH